MHGNCSSYIIIIYMYDSTFNAVYCRVAEYKIYTIIYYIILVYSVY